MKTRSVIETNQEKIGDDPGRRTLGTAQEILGKIESPMDYLQSLLQKCEESGDRVGEAHAYSNLGTAYHRLGYYEKAIHCHERHLKIAKELGDKGGEGNTYGKLGIAYYKMGDFKTAIDYHERLLKICKEAGDRAREGITCGNIGVAYNSLGDFKTAAGYHELHLQIAKEVGDRAEEGRAYRNLGNVYQNLSVFRKAIHFNEVGLKIAKEVGDKVGERSTYCNLGITHQGLGDYKRAIDFHERHLVFAKGMGIKREEGNAYGNLGRAYCRLGDFKKAVRFYELALKISKDVGDRHQEGRTYGNLGNTYRNLGDYIKAKDFFEQHLKIAKQMGDRMGEGSAYGNLGTIYLSLGDFKKAIEHLELQLKMSKEMEDRAGEGAAYGNLGNVYCSLGDLKTSIAYHKLHLKISRELGDLSGETVAYGNHGNVYHALSDFQSAIHYLELHLKLTKEMKMKREEGNAYGNLGNVYNSLGDTEKAIEYYEIHLQIAKEVEDRAGEGHACSNLGNAYYRLRDFDNVIRYKELHLKITKEIGDIAGEAKALYGLGCTFASQGILPKAVDYFQSSVRKLNDIRAHLQQKDEWKINFCHLFQSVYVCLWRVLLKQDKVAEALAAAEQGRAQALKDLMEVKYGIQPSNVVSSTLERNISNTLRCMPPTTIFIAVDKQDIVFWVGHKTNDVKLRIKEITDKRPVDDVTAFLQSLAQITRKEIGVRAHVKCEDRSLDQWTGKALADDRSVQQTPRSSTLHLKQTPRSSTLHLKPTSLKTLYDITIGPVADLIYGHELILVLEGPLCLLPYAAFVDSNSKYLSESFRIRVIPSLTSLKLITDCPADYHFQSGALLVGDPWVQEYTYKGRKLHQLPCAREEVEMIGRILNTETLTGTAATKDAVLQRLSSVALVHIAAHGRMETGEIALAPNNTRESEIPTEKDFLLTMADVLRVQIRARLVVLSCCHSGRGEIKAEGVVGIARAFMGAGARSVLVSLWAINDEATLEFMKSFYQHLAEGKSASEALKQAMKCMRESDKFSEVKHWAPFVLIGDDVTLEFGASD